MTKFTSEDKEVTTSAAREAWELKYTLTPEDFSTLMVGSTPLAWTLTLVPLMMSTVETMSSKTTLVCLHPSVGPWHINQKHIKE
jgi:hypothetical protein